MWPWYVNAWQWICRLSTIAIVHQTPNPALSCFAHGVLSQNVVLFFFFNPVLSYHSCICTGILCNENDLMFWTFWMGFIGSSSLRPSFYLSGMCLYLKVICTPFGLSDPLLFLHASCSLSNTPIQHPFLFNLFIFCVNVKVHGSSRPIL